MMCHRRVAIAAACIGSFCLGTGSQAAAVCRTGKIFTHCTDNLQDLSSQCSMYEQGSGFYNLCIGSANANVVYTCQKYRVPCGYEGTYFDNLDLDRYPKVGAPTPPRPGVAPLGPKETLLGTILNATP